jgi:hypothetical protein
VTFAQQNDSTQGNGMTKVTEVVPNSHLLHAAVCCATNVVEQQHLTTRTAAWEQAAAVDGAQSGNTLHKE